MSEKDCLVTYELYHVKSFNHWWEKREDYYLADRKRQLRVYLIDICRHSFVRITKVEASTYKYFYKRLGCHIGIPPCVTTLIKEAQGHDQDFKIYHPQNGLQKICKFVKKIFKNTTKGEKHA